MFTSLDTALTASAIGSRQRARWLVAALYVGVVACSEPRVTISSSTTEDYQRAELNQALSAYVTGGRTAAGYAQFARRVVELRGQMDATVAAEAELRLTAMALPLMRDALQRNDASALVTTVWPTGLREPIRANPVRQQLASIDERLTPLSSEAPTAYVKRICGDVLKAECYHVVPELQAPIVERLAVARFAQRARNAVDDCLVCGDDPTWGNMVRQWQLVEELAAQHAQHLATRGEPSRWPVAGQGSLPQPARGTFALVEVTALGAMLLDDQLLDVDQRGAQIAQRRGQRDVVLHVPPSAKVAELQRLLRIAGGGAVARLGLLARQPVYPWEPRVYWLVESAKARVSVSSYDTVQVLLAMADKLGEARPFRLDVR